MTKNEEVGALARYINKTVPALPPHELAAALRRTADKKRSGTGGDVDSLWCSTFA